MTEKQKSKSWKRAKHIFEWDRYEGLERAMLESMLWSKYGEIIKEKYAAATTTDDITELVDKLFDATKEFYISLNIPDEWKYDIKFAKKMINGTFDYSVTKYFNTAKKLETYKNSDRHKSCAPKTEEEKMFELLLMANESSDEFNNLF